MFPLRLSFAATKYGEWQMKSTGVENLYTCDLKKTPYKILANGLTDEHYFDKNVPNNTKMCLEVSYVW